MFSRPVQFHEFLAHHDLIDEIYKSMESPDLADPVMTVLGILRKIKNLPPLVKERKTESKSTNLRNEGNIAFSNKKLQNALICYNRALQFAPKNSRAMKLAYSNRSALLHKIKALSACLSDIETCFSMGCPPDIVEKLKKRQDEVSNIMWMERLAEAARNSTFTEEFFHMDKVNPQIPCASTNVGVIIQNNVPKLVAANDIKVGTVLAQETAFVSQSECTELYCSCYYCHKMSLNLKPCDGCVVALFCSDECREKCDREYHGIECQIMEVLEAVASGSVTKLAIKTVLKMRQMCNSWKEFISGTKTLGTERIKMSSINQIYDSKHPFSLLNNSNDKHFLYGHMYNASFTMAAIVHYLDNIPCFLPRPAEERSQAIRAIARLLMFFSLYAVHTEMAPCVSISLRNATESKERANFGWFSFLGKLANSCHPNCVTINMKKSLSLIAVAPIKRGTELTIPYIGHWLENRMEKDVRQKNLMLLYGMVCNCIICTGEYQLIKSQLTDLQKKNYRKLNIQELKGTFHPRNIQSMYGKLCKTMAFLSDVPFSDEYEEVYNLFRKCLLFIQDLESGNVIID